MSIRTQDNRLNRISGCELEFPNRWGIPTRIFANEEIPLERVAVDELESVLQIQETVEVLRRFRLASVLTPFSRCLRCNAPLEPAEKAKVLGQLEPLTKIHYDQFRRCRGCGQVYWSGSHFEKLQKRIEIIRSRFAGETAG